MTNNDIIRMARKAGLGDNGVQCGFVFFQSGINGLERFAALVAAHEREKCAKLCESLFDMDDDSCNEAETCAKAIRSRRRIHDNS